MKELTTGTATLALATGLTLTALPAIAGDQEYRITEDPLELTIHFHFYDQYVYDGNWPVEQRVAELTNIRVQNVASLATTNSQEAFNLMIAAGDLPDIVGGFKDDFIRYGLEGAFVPLNDLIEQHAPNLSAFFEARPEVRSSLLGPDGNFYHIPYIQDGEFSKGWFIRKDWLEKLGLEIPETPEEVYAVLKAFREQDPNGNGQKDEVPYFARNLIDAIRLINLWDARVSGSATDGDFAIYGGELRHPWVEDTYRVGMSNIAAWMKEGLIDPEILTRGSRAREFLLGNNLGGMTFDWFPSTSSYNVSLAETIEGFSFRAMQPPMTVSGNRFADDRRQITTPNGWGITVANENPVETIKYFDFWFSETGRRLANFGLEGVNYTLVDGKPTFTPEVLSNEKPVNAQLWQVGAQVPRGFWMDYDYEWQWTNEFAREAINVYRDCNCLSSEFTGVSLNAEEQAVYDRYWPSILSYMKENQQSWLLGGQDVDAAWDAYIEQLDSMGYQEVLAVMQGAYIRQFGGQ